MNTLVDNCLKRIELTPATCLRRDDEAHPCLLAPGPFVACGASTPPWGDRWAGVEATTAAARVGARAPETRPQLLRRLAARGALVDGVLPPRFFENLRVDALSLSAARSAEPALALAAAQTRAPTLTCV